MKLITEELINAMKFIDYAPNHGLCSSRRPWRSLREYLSAQLVPCAAVVWDKKKGEYRSHGLKGD